MVFFFFCVINDLQYRHGLVAGERSIQPVAMLLQCHPLKDGDRLVSRTKGHVTEELHTDSGLRKEFKMSIVYSKRSTLQIRRYTRIQHPKC